MSTLHRSKHRRFGAVAAAILALFGIVVPHASATPDTEVVERLLDTLRSDAEGGAWLAVRDETLAQSDAVFAAVLTVLERPEASVPDRKIAEILRVRRERPEIAGEFDAAIVEVQNHGSEDIIGRPTYPLRSKYADRLRERPEFLELAAEMAWKRSDIPPRLRWWAGTRLFGYRDRDAAFIAYLMERHPERSALFIRPLLHQLSMRPDDAYVTDLIVRAYALEQETDPLDVMELLGTEESGGVIIGRLGTIESVEALRALREIREYEQEAARVRRIPPIDRSLIGADEKFPVERIQTATNARFRELTRREAELNRALRSGAVDDPDEAAATLAQLQDEIDEAESVMRSQRRLYIIEFGIARLERKLGVDDADGEERP